MKDPQIAELEELTREFSIAGPGNRRIAGQALLSKLQSFRGTLPRKLRGDIRASTHRILHGDVGVSDTKKVAQDIKDLVPEDKE